MSYSFAVKTREDYLLTIMRRLLWHGGTLVQVTVQMRLTAVTSLLVVRQRVTAPAQSTLRICQTCALCRRCVGGGCEED